MDLVKRLVVWLLVALPTIGAAPARATLIVSEPFDYPPSSTLVGRGGGTGFNGNWVPGGFNAGVNDYSVGNGSLAYQDLATSGNDVTTGFHNVINGVTRNLASIVGGPGTTAYLSFVIRPEGTVGQGAFNGFFGLDVTGANNNELFIGKPGSFAINNYVLEQRGGPPAGSQIASPLQAISGQSALLVVRADFGTGGTDRFTLYADPTPGGPEPLAGVVKSDLRLGGFRAVTLYSTGAFSLDEIRIGTTFADVTPTAVPEPSSLALVGVGGLLLLARRCLRK